MQIKKFKTNLLISQIIFEALVNVNNINIMWLTYSSGEKQRIIWYDNAGEKPNANLFKGKNKCGASPSKT